MSEWISVKDRFPDEGKSVIAYRDSDCWYVICDFIDDAFIFGDDLIEAYEITHWMPLPGPPSHD